MSELTDELKNHADFIFEGEAVSYSPSQLRKSGQGMQPAEITFRIDKVLKGPNLKETRAQWINGTFGESKTLAEFKKTYGTKIKVGLITPEAFAKIIECKKIRRSDAATDKGRFVESCSSPLVDAGHTKKENLEKNWVVQGHCTPPFLLPMKKEK